MAADWQVLSSVAFRIQASPWSGVEAKTETQRLHFPTAYPPPHGRQGKAKTFSVFRGTEKMFGLL